jgi:hypothetical protein
MRFSEKKTQFSSSKIPIIVDLGGFPSESRFKNTFEITHGTAKYTDGAASNFSIFPLKKNSYYKQSMRK